jgi:hypothetical protein
LAALTICGIEIVRSATVVGYRLNDLVDARRFDHTLPSVPCAGRTSSRTSSAICLLNVPIAQGFGAAELALIALDNLERHLGGLALFERIEHERSDASSFTKPGITGCAPVTIISAMDGRGH